MMDGIRIENAKRKPGQRLKVRLVGKTLFINQKPFVEIIQSPSPTEVLHAVERNGQELEKISFVESNTHHVQGNVFKGYAVKLSKLQAVHFAYCKLRSLFPSRHHIMMAYDIGPVRGSCDDGEYFGDLQIAESMSAQNRDHLAIFIARSSGRKLGAKRFDMIKMITQELFTLVDGLDNQDPIDEDIPEWDKKQLTLADIIRMPVLGQEIQYDTEPRDEQEVEMDQGSVHSDAEQDA